MGRAGMPSWQPCGRKGSRRSTASRPPPSCSACRWTTPSGWCTTARRGRMSASATTRGTRRSPRRLTQWHCETEPADHKQTTSHPASVVSSGSSRTVGKCPPPAPLRHQGRYRAVTETGQRGFGTLRPRVRIPPSRLPQVSGGAPSLCVASRWAVPAERRKLATAHSKRRAGGGSRISRLPLNRVRLSGPDRTRVEMCRRLVLPGEARVRP